ncbi:MAG: response regulator [Pseudomonadota bacterium]|nr:response regulator [Pseudomonadota bacterium]
MGASAQSSLYSTTPPLVGARTHAAPTLLIVDDQPLMAEYIASVADEAGWTVDLATTSEEFEAKVNAGQPDMIALDLAMPGRDGVELLRYLSSIGYLGNLIIVSACDQAVVESSAMLAREHGLAVAGYMQKPIRPEALASLLEQVVAMIPASALDRGHQ